MVNVHEIMESYDQEHIPYSGAIFMKDKDQVVMERGYGYANRSEQISNTANTRFGMASGSKIFTAVSILQLVEKGRLALDTRLKDCVAYTFPHFHPDISVRHLLTHSSGIPDYFDEETMHGVSDFADLWKDLPMYAMTTVRSFLPLFEKKSMKFAPGERFSYSNAGYILLGLIVEELTGLRFQDYVALNIFNRCEMNDTGYYRLDQLPARTAIGYIEEGETYRSNMYSLPIIGGPDGGAFTTVYDMEKFWSALIGHVLLSKHMTDTMLTPQTRVNEYIHYGYGVWITIRNNEIIKFFVMGSDPGIEMQSSVYPQLSTQVHLMSNNGHGAGAITKRIDERLPTGNPS